MNPFKEKERQLQTLLDKYNEDGDNEAFKTALAKLTVDYHGQTWRLGVAGKWEKQVGAHQWEIVDPPREETVEPEAGPPTEPAEAEPAQQKPAQPGGGADTAAQPDAPPKRPSVAEETASPGASAKVTPVAGSTSREPADEKEESIPQPLWRRPVAIAGGILILLCVGAMMVFNAFKPGGPTPTATPPAETTPTEISVAAATATPTATSVPPTATATSTLVPGDTPLPTPTGTPVPTETPVPTATGTPPPTAVPPTALPTHTLAPSATATPTPVIATPTPIPAFTGILAYPLFDSAKETYNIHLVDLSANAEIRVIKNASQPDISPNGTKIVYRSWESNGRGLFVEDLRTGANRWQASNLFEAGRPVWDAAGNDIVYNANNVKPEQWDILFQVDRAAGYGGHTPAWFAKDRVIYQGNSGANSGLIVTGSSSPFLTQSPQDKAPAVSPGGSDVVFMSDRDGQWDLYQVSVNSRQVTRLTQDTALDTSPIWSPDGARIAFVSNRGGSWAIRTIDSDGNNDQILLPLPGSFNGKVKDVPDTYQTGWQLEHISWVK